jgi:carboxyl-terminal processing protease
MPRLWNVTPHIAIATALLFWSQPAVHRSRLTSWFSLGGQTADQMVVDVPVEHPPIGSTPTREALLLHQILRIIDSQYLDSRRIQPTTLLQAGLETLTDILGSDLVETTPRNQTVVAARPDGGTAALLCSNAQSQSRSFHLCPRETDRSPTPGTMSLAAKPLAPRSRTTAQDLLVRIGPRVFSIKTDSNRPLAANEAMLSSLLSILARTAERDPKDLVHLFANGLLAELDPHSSFLNEREYRDLQMGTMGRFSGIGVVLDTSRQFPVVEEVVPGSAASRAGVMSDDIMVRIGDNLTAFDDINKIVLKLRSSSESKPIAMWFYRPRNHTLFRADLVRDEIENGTVTVRAVPEDDSTLFIRLSSFSEQTAEDLWAAYDHARNTRPTLTSMVLDLRGNPGGLLDEAVDVASLFMQREKIVSVQSRYEQQEEFASERSSKIDLPLALLVDSGSASAAEILAGALKDHNRALVVGERTYGKGSVQSVFETGSNTALKLSVAHYFTPNGGSIQGRGITPHVWMRLLLERNKTLYSAGPSEAEREFDLPSHLENPETSSTTLSRFELLRAPDPALELWAWQPQDQDPGTRTLTDFDLSLPQLAQRHGAVNLKTDSYARIAIGLLRLSADRGKTGEGLNVRPVGFDSLAIASAINQLQEREKSHFPRRDLLGDEKALLRNRQSQVAAGEFQRLSPSGRSFLFTLRAKWENQQPPGKGYVILAQKGREDGPNPVIPVSREPTTARPGVAYRFEVPESFSAKLAQDGGAEIDELVAYFVTSLQDAPIPIGTFRWQVESQKSTAIDTTTKENTSACSRENGPRRCFVVTMQTRSSACANAACRVQVVSMLPAEIRVENTMPRLVQTGDSSFEIPIELSLRGEPETPKSLSGLVGIILRNTQGDLVHKFPAVMLNGEQPLLFSRLSENRR